MQDDNHFELGLGIGWRLAFCISIACRCWSILLGVKPRNGYALTLLVRYVFLLLVLSDWHTFVLRAAARLGDVEHASPPTASKHSHSISIPRKVTQQCKCLALMSTIVVPQYCALQQRQHTLDIPYRPKSCFKCSRRSESTFTLYHYWYRPYLTSALIW